MKRLAARRFAIAACALALAGCGSFPENPKLPRYDPSAGYRFDNLQRGGNSDKLFVILTFSGGGTRAAALSFGVLEALRDAGIPGLGPGKTLLDEVDVISSVSGGSFTAAYYGLHDRDAFFETFPPKFLNRPVQGDLVKQLFSPANWFRLAGASYGRSDLAAAYYDRRIFDGATYADLIARNRRPFVVLNATDMTIGARFPFIQDRFDLICSDLAGLPVARAAAASSAFPGLLTPLTFRNYAGTCGYDQPVWVKNALADKARLDPRFARRSARVADRLSYTARGAARRDFIHLVDGGVADNIGLRGPLAAIMSSDNAWSILRRIANKEIDRLVVVVVDAATDPATGRDKTAGVPGLVDTLTTAATVPLDNYSFDSLDLLRETVDGFNQEATLIAGCKKLARRRGAQCVPDITAPHRVEFYPIQIGFDYLPDAAERAWFKNLPTTFELPPATIEKLRDAGRTLLQNNREYKRLISDLR